MNCKSKRIKKHRQACILDKIQKLALGKSLKIIPHKNEKHLVQWELKKEEENQNAVNHKQTSAKHLKTFMLVIQRQNLQRDLENLTFSKEHSKHHIIKNLINSNSFHQL